MWIEYVIHFRSYRKLAHFYLSVHHTWTCLFDAESFFLHFILNLSLSLVAAYKALRPAGFVFQPDSAPRSRKVEQSSSTVRILSARKNGLQTPLTWILWIIMYIKSFWNAVKSFSVDRITPWIQRTPCSQSDRAEFCEETTCMFQSWSQTLLICCVMNYVVLNRRTAV